MNKKLISSFICFLVLSLGVNVVFAGGAKTPKSITSAEQEKV